MRVQMTNSSKMIFAVAEMPTVNRIISLMKEDESSIEEYCRMAANLISNERWEIHRPVAEMCKNSRANDNYFEGSKNADVWISFLAFDSFAGAYEIGICMTDIWSICEDNRDEIISHMYINKFDGQKPKVSSLNRSTNICRNCFRAFDDVLMPYLSKANFCPACGCKWERETERIKEKEKEF